MKTRWLRVTEEPPVFASLVAAMTAAGMRCGWLDLERGATPPAELEAAAGLGVLRAVAAVGGRVVSVKPVVGGFVLRDLLREHFTGCELVLVRGAVEAATLDPGPEAGWKVVFPGGTVERLPTDELVRNLRRPSWGARDSSMLSG